MTKSIKSASKKINTTKKTGKEATLQTEMQQAAGPRPDKEVGKKAQKTADQKKKEVAPGIPGKSNSKQAGSETDVKPDANITKKKAIRKH